MHTPGAAHEMAHAPSQPKASAPRQRGTIAPFRIEFDFLVGLGIFGAAALTLGIFSGSQFTLFMPRRLPAQIQNEIWTLVISLCALGGIVTLVLLPLAVSRWLKPVKFSLAETIIFSFATGLVLWTTMFREKPSPYDSTSFTVLPSGVVTAAAVFHDHVLWIAWWVNHSARDFFLKHYMNFNTAVSLFCFAFSLAFFLGAVSRLTLTSYPLRLILVLIASLLAAGGGSSYLAFQMASFCLPLLFILGLSVRPNSKRRTA